MNQVYLDSARLLTRVAPLVLVEDTFALKGGTAMNLFVRDMPRLSVDLDLVFPDHTLPREQALQQITGRCTNSCFRRRATSARSSSTIAGMTAEPIELDALLAARERMMRELQQGLSADERRFLLSLVGAAPEWSLLGVPHLEQLPGLRWKLQNLERLRKTNARIFAKQSDVLGRLMGNYGATSIGRL